MKGVHGIFTNSKVTMNYEYDTVVGVILPVLKLKLTKAHPLFYTFCQKHSDCFLASGKNGSTP